MKNLSPVNETGDLPTYVETYSIQVFTFPDTLSVGLGQARLYFHRASEVVGVRPGVGTAPATQSVIFDLNKNGTTMFTTQGNRPTVAAGANSGSITTPDVTSVAAGDYLTVDVDQVGTGTAGSDGTVIVEYRIV